MTTDQNNYLIHGYSATPTANWFPWLKTQLNIHLNQELNILTMPDTNHPNLEAWLGACERDIASSDGITLIGHSLGCITALRFLEKQTIKNVNLILVSGFDDKIETLPELDEFTQQPLDIQRLLPKINQITVISARDDDIVPYRHTEKLARDLDAPFILMPHGQHFIDRDGTTKLPVVYDVFATFQKN